MFAKPHKSLESWKTLVLFVKDIYNVTKSFPPEEKFGMTSQLRRAAVSVPSNIAEGASRRAAKGSDREFLHFLNIALGSVAELDTLIVLAEMLEYIPTDNALILQTKLDQTGKLLHGLIRKINPRE